MHSGFSPLPRSGFLRLADLARLLLVASLAWAAFPRATAAEPALKTRNVFLITSDGLRWQEMFNGADEAMLNKEFGGMSETNYFRKELWRDTPEARRAALFPFLWNTVAKQGQIWGNRQRGSEVRVTNGKNFSYPGYSEFLTGVADPAIDSNDKVLNPHTNVVEWLGRQPAFRGHTAAAVNWDVLPWVLNTPRSGIPIWSGFDVPAGTQRLPVPAALDEMVERGRTIWSGDLLDTFVGYAAKHTVRTRKPRVLFVSYGETDDWAHEGRYDRYLRACREFDRFVGELWAQCQADPQYRDKTTFFITADHGRGPSPVAWKNHGKEIVESAYIWFAVLGPDHPGLGERTNTPLVTQSQVAATLAALLGQDFHAAHPDTAPPISGLRPGQEK